MTTIKNIQWEVGSRFDDAGDGHTFFHYGTGIDQDGARYQGVIVKVDDNIETIEDIEQVND